MSGLTLYPAIDIRGGQAVRLTQGDYERETVYESDPVDAARSWVDAGAKWLHVVDLDGARSAQPQNLAHITRIARDCHVPVQCGGGLRNPPAIEAALATGVRRVILGTGALRDADFLRQALAIYEERIVVSVDARDGMVAAEGWTEASDRTTGAMLNDLDQLGVQTIVYTNIANDGMLTGIDTAETAEICASTSARVIASGGIGSLDDLKRLAAIDADNLDGVIVGKALYERRFSLADALAALAGQ